MLAEKEAVIGRDDERSVAPKIVCVEIVEKLSHQKIAKRDDGVVVGAQLLAFLWQLVDAAVARPVADRPIPAGPEFLAKSLGRGERLMRVERLDLQEPVVRCPVAVEELEAGGKTLHRRVFALFSDELAVDDVAAELVACRAAELPLMVHLAQALPRRLHHGFPRIALLPADEVVAVVAGVVGGATILEIMEVVGDEVAVDAGLAQQLGKRIVERLERPPAPVEKAETSGLHVAARRHAGQAADIMTLECCGALGKTGEIGRRHARSAIWGEHMAVERVEKNEDGFHRTRQAITQSRQTLHAV